MKNKQQKRKKHLSPLPKTQARNAKYSVKSPTHSLVMNRSLGMITGRKYCNITKCY